MFLKECEDQLPSEMFAQMQQDCANHGNDLDAIRELFDNIEEICEEKNVTIELDFKDPILCGEF